jgi:hypothetical protein
MEAFGGIPVEEMKNASLSNEDIEFVPKKTALYHAKISEPALAAKGEPTQAVALGSAFINSRLVPSPPLTDYTLDQQGKSTVRRHDQSEFVAIAPHVPSGRASGQTVEDSPFRYARRIRTAQRIFRARGI